MLKKRLSAFTKLDHEECIRKIAQGNQTRLEARWRIFSLAGNATSELLWAHYADSHRGVALVFDASQHAFGCALRVWYVDQLAPLDITQEEPSLSFRHSLLTKRTAWSYEEEYRWIAAESDDPFTPLQDQLLTFAPEHLIGVIFGANMNVADKRLIAGWRDERQAKMMLWQASVASTGDIVVSSYAE